MVKDLLIQYKKFVEPYMQDGNGNGIFRLTSKAELDQLIEPLNKQLKLLKNRNSQYIETQGLFEEDRESRQEKLEKILEEKKKKEESDGIGR